jgi:iron complex outermembrane receptor protein
MHDAHMVQLNAENLFDQRYAVEATKDVSGRYSYAAAAPRSVMATYTYSF